MVNLLKQAKTVLKRAKAKLHKKSTKSRPKVFNLNDDCLEKVFKYLSLRDLYNVAEASSFFVDAARWEFKRKIGNGAIKVNSYEISIESEHFKGLKIHLNDPLVVDTFFNNFGAAVSRINIFLGGGELNEIEQRVLNYSEEMMAVVRVYRTWRTWRTWTRTSKKTTKFPFFR